ncbi:MAG: hypothetical protein H0U42_02190 [Thermoleophilaceae bacterium]|nr:hypothetical protein [Thermoleophilaceae bacterium]
MPAPGLLGRLNTPIAKRFAAIAGADEAAVRADLEKLPGQLDRVDELIAAGTIGGPDPNAADFQIGTTMRTILRFADLRPVVEGRAAAELGERILPDYGFEVPAFLPPEWLAALRS